ncbi:MAG: hypothetical protein AMXMBFR4_25830 [Candidatus Hydrogenedentota bacterium]
MLPHVSFAAAVAPALLLVRYFHLRDIYPEPPKVLWTTFFLGALIVAPVLGIVYPLHYCVGVPAGYAAQGLWVGFVYAAIPEEFFKLAVLRGYSLRQRAFDEPMDGVVYGVVASLGFAAFENVMYVMQGGLGLALMRALTAVPAHAFMGVIMGYYVGRAQFDPQRRAHLMGKGFLYAVLVHGFYDAPLLTVRAMVEAHGDVPPERRAQAALLILAALGVLVFAMIWAARLARSARRDQIERRVPPPVPLPLSLPEPVGRARGPFLLALGGTLWTLGGVAAVGGGLMLVFGEHSFGHTADRILMIAFLGVLPIWIGRNLFRRGVIILNTARPSSTQHD